MSAPEKEHTPAPNDMVQLDEKQAAEELLTYVLARPDVIRQRAQYAAAIAGLSATGVAAAGSITDVARFSSEIGVVVLLAVLLWLTSLGWWVWTIGGPLKPVGTPASAERRAAQLSNAITSAKENARKARKRLLIASGFTSAAVAATVVGFGWAAVYAEMEDNAIKADVRLSSSAARAAADICGWEEATVRVQAKVRRPELSRSVVTLKMPDEEHRFEGRVLRLRSRDLLAVSFAEGR